MTTNQDQPGKGVVSAPTALLVMAVALLLGSLLNARPLESLAGSLSPGPTRTVAVAATDVLSRLSTSLFLDRPRALLESMIGSEAPDPGEPGGPRAVFLPTPNRPALMLVAGDSLVDPFGPELVTAASETGVIRGRWDVRYSSGLTRPQIVDWVGVFEQELGSAPADIVVFMVGANDVQPIETDEGWVSSNDPAWEAEYRSRIDAVMSSLTERAATVYWVGQPIAREGEHSARMERLNALYASVADDHPTVRYVDSWAVFADDQGHYADFLPDGQGELVLMRQTDGIHFTPAGGRLLAEAVLDAIREDWTIDR